jgi:lysophospholipase L1-like esterase
MALTAKKVYAILKRQISDMEAKLNSPVRYRGTVATADLLPLNPDIGDMYNIESKSIYGEAGMNVAWNGVVWDTMGAPIDMSLYIKSSELADWAKQPQKPDYTAEEVGALPANTKIPSKTSDLQNDSGFLTKIPDNYLSGTDKTLSASGKAADAKATGDKITELSADISNKLNKNQGSENSGKIAGINESGDIVPMFPVSVDYNEETNCLEFGSDQKMELNKGINLDSTLTKTGYAADAGAVGEITNSLKEDFGRVSPSAEYIGKNLVIPSVKDILVDKTTHYGKTLDTTKAGNSEEVYTDNVERNCSALNAIESNTAYTIFSVGHNQRLQLFWRIAFYDSNYAHIKDIYDVVRFTSPDNAAYFIVDTYSTDSSIKSEALESFSMVYVVNGTYDFEQIRSIFPLRNNKLENTRATTGYEGKTWMCIGDSITEHNFRALFNYHDYASKELGINIINCGISGSGYIIHDSGEESATIPPFYKRIEGYANTGYKPDLITIFGGINDLMFTDTPVGENTDMTVDTLLGGVNLAIAKIKQYFPNVPFAIISPLPAYACQDNGTCYADYSPSSKTNKEYLFIAALADYCDYHGIPFLNLYNQTGFRPWDENFRTEYTKYSPSASPDGLHPNAKGHALIYPKIREFIKTLI